MHNILTTIGIFTRTNVNVCISSQVNEIFQVANSHKTDGCVSVNVSASVSASAFTHLHIYLVAR